MDSLNFLIVKLFITKVTNVNISSIRDDLVKIIKNEKF